MTDTTRTPPTKPQRAPARLKTGALLSMLVGSAFVMLLNETMLSVALRDLTVGLGVSATTTQWLTSGFLLTMAVVIPITGYLLERFTPRQVFLTAMTLFATGTLVCGLAPGFAMLLVGRIVQAAGTAMTLPLLMTSALRLVPPQRRGATMGTITIVIAMAPALGPTLGGAVLAAMGWRWMFWIVLPLAIASLVIGARWLHVDGATRAVPLDVPSVLLSAVGFSGVLYGLSTFAGSDGEPIVPPGAPIAIGAIALLLFVFRQLRLQRDDRALLDLRPFTHRSFVIGLTLVSLVFMCLLGAASILLPLYLQTVLHASTFVSGLALLPGGLVMGLLGRPVGALFDRVGPRPLVIPGSAAMAVALLLFTTLGPDSSVIAVVAIHVLLTVGLALMMTPLMTSSLGTLPEHLHSHGSAILSTLQQVAGAFGTAMFVTVATLGADNPAGVPDATGLRLAFVVATALGALAFGTSLFLRKPASS